MKKCTISYKMSLVAFTLYIIINLRKESDNNPKMHIALEIYMFQVYLTHQKTYMLFVTLILYLYIMRRTKSDKMSLIAYHCNRYIYINVLGLFDYAPCYNYDSVSLFYQSKIQTKYPKCKYKKC